MGWLYMKTLGGFGSPQEYLDDQFSYAHGDTRSRVLRSAIVKRRTYYAAVEALQPDKDREVIAVICPVSYNPRARDGHIFGYKDMSENAGPCEAACPLDVLDILTSTSNEYALEWREKCRKEAARRKAIPKLRNGWTLVFDEPIVFTDGASHARLEIVIDPRRPRTVRLRAPGGYGLYRINNLTDRNFRVEAGA